MTVPDRVVILNNVSAARGGATALALLLARKLRERSVPVTFVCNDRGSNPDLAAQGVEAVAVGTHDDRPEQAGGLVTGLHNAAASRALKAWMAANDTPRTIYHLHGWAHGLSPSVFAPLRAAKGRVVLHAHDYFLACPNGAYFDYRREEACTRRPLSISCLGTNCDKRKFIHKAWRVARHAARQAAFNVNDARIFLIHEGMAPHMARAGIAPRAMTTVRNPIAALLPTRVEAERNRTAIYIGRLEPEKGVEDALAAARAAGQRLVVVGDGPMRATLEAAHPEAVFLGWLKAGEIAAQLATARVALMPSRYPEPFGMVCLEAIGAGVPVILPPSALLSRDVAEHGLGHVCDTRDIAAFAATLTRVFDDDEGVAESSRRGFARLRQLAPDADGWIDTQLDLYAGMLGDAAETRARAGRAQA